MLKVISTLGPSSNNENTIKKLTKVSSSFRINASHLTSKQLNDLLNKIDKIYKSDNKYKREVVIDLKGAKTRIGEYPSVKSLARNISIKNISISKDKNVIPVSDKNFFDNIKIKDKLYLNDASVILEVVKLNNDNIECIVLKNGELSSNKGINIKNHPIKYKSITPVDKSMIEIANKFDFSSFAFSFVLDGSEFEILRQYTNKKIIAKIERPEAIKNIVNIDDKFDETWLCRGDLGSQAGIEKLGELQYNFTQNIKNLKKSTYLAGQVLHHLTFFETPTRTEIASLYQIKKEGYKGFVLSDETAVGKNIDFIIDFLEKVNI